MSVEIRIRSGGTVIKFTDRSIINYIKPVALKLTEITWRKDWKTQSTVKEIKAKYFIADWENNELRFHSVHTKELLDALSKHPRYNTFTIIKEPISKATPIELNYTNQEKQPYKRQPEYIKFISNMNEHIRVLPASPGQGKTLCTIYAMTEVKVKTAILLSASLRENWEDSLYELTDIKPEDMLYISGSNGLIDYMDMIINEEDNYKVVIFSNNTIQSFMKRYKECEDYPLTPDELFDMGGFGLKVVDEAHRWLHFHAILDMYSNINTHIFLTGTLMSESPFLANMENTLFSDSNRCEVDPPTNHVALIAYGYRFSGEAPKCQGVMGYNHMKLESGIKKNKKYLNNYLYMCAKIVHNDFVTVKAGKEKALVYFATVDMVKAFTEYLNTHLPHIETVSCLAGDDETVFKTADVIASTTKKLGTGTDITGLTYVLQTIMISAKGEGFQNVGRLRSRPDGKTTFAYIHCADIPKHNEYHNKRLKDFKPLINSTEIRTLNDRV